jgi:hypothetical protein
VDSPAYVVKAAPAGERRTGPVAAAFLGLCAGQFAMGVFSLVDQAVNPTEWVPPAGREAGLKMVFMWSNYAVMTGLFVQTLMAWLITWAIAHEVLGRRRHVATRVWVVSGVLLGLGLLFSFTPFYNWLLPG